MFLKEELVSLKTFFLNYKRSSFNRNTTKNEIKC